jgi:outer membrane protein OmpA-like peptidoglycan-associated protein
MKAIFISLFMLVTFAGMSQYKGSLTLYFDFNKHNLGSGAKMNLDSFLLARKQDQLPVNIELSGHCDFIGSDEYNDTLSEKRVTTVKNYLLANGIAPGNIITAKGLGKRNPLNENKTAEERRLNRRVEMLITEIAASPATRPAEQETTAIPEKEKKVSLQQKITDSSVVAGSTIVLKNINFYGGMHRLLPESLPALRELLEVMKANPGLVIEVQGHICCEPGIADGYDAETRVRNLSVARAKVIHDHLIANGIEAKRVSYKGLGHSKPIYPYPEQTNEERIANRRVEIKIISK